MHDPAIAALEARIEALEIRLTYQDDSLETLNAAVTAQRAQMDVMTRQLAELCRGLQDAQTDPSASVERPPHY